MMLIEDPILVEGPVATFFHPDVDPEIVAGVMQCLSGVTGADSQKITLHQTLIDDLHLDSIDMIDLIYQLEDKFEIQIKIGELEGRARASMGDRLFSVDNVVTEEGLAALKELIPGAPTHRIKPGLLTQEIPYLFTVKSLCQIVESKVNAK